MSEISEIREKKPKKTKDEIIEIIIIIMLGVTALCTAWASWVGSLHEGNQAGNYTSSNNVAADGNSQWNEAAQYLSQDMMIWNTISDLMVERDFADQAGDTVAAEKFQWKLDQILYDNVSEDFDLAINWAIEQEAYATPFEMEGYVDSYFASAQAVIAESEELLAKGEQDNKSGDAFGLVTVIYSLVLFLLGIASTFKSTPNKMVLTIISVAAFALATVYMVTIPLPTGFDLFSFLNP